MKNKTKLLTASVLLGCLVSIGSIAAVFAENSTTSVETTNYSMESTEKVNQAATPLGYDIDPRVQKNLEKNGVEFYPEFPLDTVAIKESVARAIADKSLIDDLTQEPLEVVVQYGSFTYPPLNIVDKKVWKITYIGTSMKLNGPRMPEGQSIEQPTSKKAVTWVTVDAENGEIINRYSSGPKRD